MVEWMRINERRVARLGCGVVKIAPRLNAGIRTGHAGQRAVQRVCPAINRLQNFARPRWRSSHGVDRDQVSVAVLSIILQ